MECNGDGEISTVIRMGNFSWGWGGDEEFLMETGWGWEKFDRDGAGMGTI